MAAIKKVVICFLWAFSSTLLAGEDPKFIDKQQEDEIINLAYMQMRTSIGELEKKINECRLLEKNTTLNPSLLQPLSLTKQETRTVLKYFYSLSQDKCEGLEWEKASIEFAKFKYIEKFYKGKNIIETKNNFDVLCCMGLSGRLEAKWQYLKIPPETREKLQRIPELMQPFDPVKTAEIMGLLETIEQ